MADHKRRQIVHQVQIVDIFRIPRSVFIVCISAFFLFFLISNEGVLSLSLLIYLLTSGPAHILSVSPPAYSFKKKKTFLAFIFIRKSYLRTTLHWCDAVSAVQERPRLIAHSHQNGKSANVCLRREAVQLGLQFKGTGISFPCSAAPSNPFSQGFSAVIFFDCRSG